jgi:hypothetical protein
MARTLIVSQVPVGPFPAGGTVAPAALKVTETGADAVNMNKFVFSGKDVLLAHNTDTGAHTITLTSAPDEHGRSSDIATYSIPAGEIHAFSFRQGSAGWLQADGNVYIQANDATVKFAVLAINN